MDDGNFPNNPFQTTSGQGANPTPNPTPDPNSGNDWQSLFASATQHSDPSASYNPTEGFPQTDSTAMDQVESSDQEQSSSDEESKTKSYKFREDKHQKEYDKKMEEYAAASAEVPPEDPASSRFYDYANDQERADALESYRKGISKLDNSELSWRPGTRYIQKFPVELRPKNSRQLGAWIEHMWNRLDYMSRQRTRYRQLHVKDICMDANSKLPKEMKDMFANYLERNKDKGIVQQFNWNKWTQGGTIRDNINITKEIIEDLKRGN